MRVGWVFFPLGFWVLIVGGMYWGGCWMMDERGAWEDE